MNKKIRNAQLKQFNYIVVAGDDELEGNFVDVRSRTGDRIGKKTIEELSALLASEYPESVPLPGENFNK